MPTQAIAETEAVTKDGGIQKTVIRNGGEKGIRVVPGAKVTVRFVGRIVDEGKPRDSWTVFDQTRFGGETEQGDAAREEEAGFGGGMSPAGMNAAMGGKKQTEEEILEQQERLKEIKEEDELQGYELTIATGGGTGDGEEEEETPPPSLLDAKGLREALLSMREGEMSRFTLKPEYAYGEAGKKEVLSDDYKVPPGATVEYELRVMSVDDDPVELWDLKDPQKYKKAVETKVRANAFYKESDYPHAVSTYRKAMKLVDDIFQLEPRSEEQRNNKELYQVPLEDVKDLKITLLCNMAQAKLKMAEYNSSIVKCNLALRARPSHAKALFIRGQAYANKFMFEEAKRDLREAVSLQPKKAAFRAAFKAARESEKKQKKRSKRVFGNIFESAAKQHAAEEARQQARRQKAEAFRAQKAEKEEAKFGSGFGRGFFASSNESGVKSRGGREESSGGGSSAGGGGDGDDDEGMWIFEQDTL